MKNLIQAIVLVVTLGVVAWCSAQAIVSHDQKKVWWGP